MKEYQYQDVDRRGTLQRLDYVGANGVRKYAQVYLPFGYDTEPERRYDVLYLMHGGGGNPDTWLDSCPIKNMLDFAIASGEAKPLIVVFPCFYGTERRRGGAVDAPFEHQCVLTFQRELTENLLPAAEGAFRTWAEGTDPASLKRARDHRAFGGFSMGSVNTWYAFSLHFDYFSVFLPLSGDCWALDIMGGSKDSAGTARMLRDSVLSRGFGPEDFRIYAATGTEDIACPNMTPQIEAMKALDDVFRFSADPGAGNFHFLLAEGMIHSYHDVCRYFYYYLPFLFIDR